MTSALRCSHSRLASGAEECVSTSVFSSIARTVAPASITSVVRLRWRTLSRTVGHMVRTAAALSSPSAAAAGSGAGGGAGSGTGGGAGSGTGSGLATGGATSLGGAASCGAARVRRPPAGTGLRRPSRRREWTCPAGSRSARRAAAAPTRCRWPRGATAARRPLRAAVAAPSRRASRPAPPARPPRSGSGWPTRDGLPGRASDRARPPGRPPPRGLPRPEPLAAR